MTKNCRALQAHTAAKRPARMAPQLSKGRRARKRRAAVAVGTEAGAPTPQTQLTNNSETLRSRTVTDFEIARWPNNLTLRCGERGGLGSEALLATPFTVETLPTSMLRCCWWSSEVLRLLCSCRGHDSTDRCITSLVVRFSLTMSPPIPIPCLDCRRLRLESPSVKRWPPT